LLPQAATNCPHPHKATLIVSNTTILWLLQVSAWQQHTTAELQEVWLEGLGHNYIADAPESLLQTIATQLTGASSNSHSNQAAGPAAARSELEEQQRVNATAALNQQSSKEATLPSQPRSPKLKHCCPCQ
jgi:hypothetical protein